MHTVGRRSSCMYVIRCLPVLLGTIPAVLCPALLWAAGHIALLTSTPTACVPLSTTDPSDRRFYSTHVEEPQSVLAQACPDRLGLSRLVSSTP